MAEENNNQQQVPFEIKKVFLKDASFESPESPAVFTRDFKPQVSVEFNNESTKVEENHYEVVLRLTVTCKQDDKVSYLCEVKQAGVFYVNFPQQEQVDHVINAMIPSILFPYASEAVCNFVVKGGFPQIVLPPVNFELLYAQRLAQAKQGENKSAE